MSSQPNAIDYLFATRQDRRPTPELAGPTIDSAPVEVSNIDKYVDSAFERTLNDLANTGEGRRNPALNEAAFALGRFVAANLLPEHSVEAGLLNACQDNGLLTDDGERTCTATIRSGLRGGARHPFAYTIKPASPTFEGIGLSLTGTAPPAAEASADHDVRVQAYLADMRARDEARKALDAEKAAREFRAPPSTFTLTDELAIPDEPVSYAITDILPVGANALLTAAFKTGKTTVVGDLARAFADGEQFLGKFDLADQGGRLAIFNYELSDGQYRRWLRDLDIANPDRVCVLHLRGFRLPVIVPEVEEWVVRWLAERDVRMWTVDPFARAFTGCGNENDNGEVGRFLDTLDVIKARAGVSELVLPTHTGRMIHELGQERARGATRLDDWADVRWMLNKLDDDDPDGTPPRFFSATGRDVDVAEERLHYDPDSRRLRMSGHDRKGHKSSKKQAEVLEAIRAQPGINVTDLRARVGGGTAVDSAVRALESALQVRVDRDRKPFAHYPFSAGWQATESTEDAA